MLLSPGSLLEDAHRRAARHGVDLIGVVDVRQFDRCQSAGHRIGEHWPHLRTALVLAVAGDREVDPDLPGRLQAELAPRTDGAPSVVAVCPRREAWLRFGVLAEEAGIAAVSPLLRGPVHPQFGPWVRVLGALLVDEAPPAGIGASETDPPCTDCRERRCVVACPAGALDSGVLDEERCGQHRRAGGCVTRCAARCACPVGEEWAWGEVLERRAQDAALPTPAVNAPRGVLRSAINWRRSPPSV